MAYAVKAPDNRWFERVHSGHPMFVNAPAKAQQMTAAAATKLARKLHQLGYRSARAVPI